MAEINKYNAGNDSSHGENLYTLYYDKAGIKAANRKNLYGQFASKKEMPTKLGKTYAISRWLRSYDRPLTDPEFNKKGFISSRDIADVTAGFTSAKLEEGAKEKDSLKITKINLKTTLNRYGEELDYTDEVEIFSNDDIQVRYREDLGERANSLFEDLVQYDMLSTNNVMYSGAGTSLSTMGTGITADGSLDDNYRISYDYLRRCVQKLVRNRASKNTEMVTGDTKPCSKPVPAAYYAIIGPEIKFDLTEVTRGEKFYEKFTFVPAYKYASGKTLAEGEIGMLGEVCFIESAEQLVYEKAGVDVPVGYVGDLSYTGEIGNGAKFDVFPILFPTKDSFATVGLKGHGKVVFNAQAPSQVDSGNRFGTRGWFTYNMWYAGIILQEEKLLKGLVLATGTQG